MIFAARYEAEGAPRGAARRRALLETEGVECVREAVRDQRVGASLNRLGRDLRSAWRTQAWLTATAMLSLALGIGANTAVFSVRDAILVQALPYVDAERLVPIRSTHTTPERGSPPDGERTAAANLADAGAFLRGAGRLLLAIG
jgi:putative ABC transport system permease protein